MSFQVHHRATTSAQDRYLALSTRCHRQTSVRSMLVTLLLCLENEFPGKKSTHKCPAETGLYAQRASSLVCSFDYIQHERPVILERKASTIDITRMRSCSCQ
ncbi:hypothetical protein TNCV_3959131 [Trichonephila clavipes]|nr:hypothetical protein TNCV_3959131 [Trichonephila clavipes]